MKTVVITGGTGYIAHFVIAEFLKAGYNVRASVRSDEKGKMLADKFDHENFTYFLADLTTADGWSNGLKNADILVHVASPLGGENVIETAVNGTLNVLEAAKSAGVKRVIMTSSEAASTGSAEHSGVLNEDFWADETDLDGYRLSKLRSEKAAWEFAQANDLDLTTILPGSVFGPIFDGKNISTNSILQSLLTGDLPFTVNAEFDITNVSDLAHLFRLTVENDKSIGQRYFAASQILKMSEIAEILRSNFPEKSVSDTILDDETVKNTAELKDFLPMMNRDYRYSTAKAENELDWQQTAATATILQAAQDLISHDLA